jgi:acetyl esterase/lipase
MFNAPVSKMAIEQKVPNSSEEGLNWTPRGKLAWSLTISAILLTAFVVTTSLYMVNPMSYGSLGGELGYLGLLFTPQLIVISIVSIVLAYVARRILAWFSVILYTLCALVTLLIVILSTVSIYQRARQYNVPISVFTALSPTINSIGPQNFRTVFYGTTSDGTRLELDMWRVKNFSIDVFHPAIVRVHGGVWIEGERNGLGMWNQWFNDLGYDVFDISYRLPPAANWKNTNEVADVKCAIGWVFDHAREYHIDTASISLTGYSAGGNLALLAAYTMGNLSLPPSCPAKQVRIRSVINFYGPADLESLYLNSGTPEYVQNVFPKYIGASLAEKPDEYKKLSPLTYVRKGLPPTMTLLGESDRLVPAEQGIRLDIALKKAGVHHELYLIPWTDHEFDGSWNSLACQIAREKVKHFLDRYGSGK